MRLWRYLRFSLKLLLGILRPMVILLVASVIGLLGVLADPPASLRQWLIELASQQLEAAVGLPLQIGQIANLQIRLSHQDVVLRQVRLYGYPKAPAPLLMVPEIHVRLNGLAYLMEQPALVEIKLTQPHVNLIRQANGQLNLRPRFQPTKESPTPGPRPRLPEVKFKITQAVVGFRDQDRHYPLQTRLSIPTLELQVPNQEQVFYSLTLFSDLANLQLRGKLNIWKGQGQARLALDNPNVKKIAGYSARIPNLTITAGAIGSQAIVAWDNYQGKNLRYAGSVHIAHLKGKVPYLKTPIEVSTQIDINHQHLQVHQLALQMGQAKISLKGSLRHYASKPQLNSQLQIHSLSVQPTLQALQIPGLEALKALHPSGHLQARLHVHGTLPDIKAQGQLTLPQAQIAGIQLRQARAVVSYSGDKLLIPALHTQIFGGNLTLRGQANLKREQLHGVQVVAQGISLTDMQHQLKLPIPKEYHPHGLLNLQASAQGSFYKPQVVGNLNSPRLSLPGHRQISPLHPLKTRFSYQNNNLQLVASGHSDDAGPFQLGVKLRQLNDLQAQVKLPRMPLRVINEWTQAANFSQGTSQLDGSFRGKLSQLKRDWKTFDAALQVETLQPIVNYPLSKTKNQTQWVKQKLDTLTLASEWKNGVVTLHHLELENNQSSLKGHGQIRVDRLMAANTRKSAIDITLEGKVDVRDFPILQRYDVTAGEVHLNGHLNTLAQGDWKFNLVSTGQHMVAQGYSVDQFRIDSVLNDNLVEIRQAELQQGKNLVTAKGSINIKAKEPVMNIQVQSDQFDVPALVTMLPSQLRQKLEGKDTAPVSVPLNPKVTHYSLPQAHKMTLFQLPSDTLANPQLQNLTQVRAQQLVIPTGQQMEHWSDNKAEPNRQPRPLAELQPSLLATLAGKLSVFLDIQGTPQHPQVQLQSLLSNTQIYDKKITEAYVQARYQQNKVFIDHLHVLEQQGGSLQAQGNLDPDGEIELEIQGQDIGLNLANSWLKESQKVYGKAELIAAVKGPTRSPQVTAELNINHLFTQSLYFDRVETITGYENGFLQDARTELHYGDKQIVVNGVQIPVLDRNKPMNITLKLEDDSFGLVNLFTQSLDWRQGKGSILVNLIGTPRHPELTGTIDFRDTTVYLPAIKELVTDMSLKGEIFTKTFKLDYLKGKYAGGLFNINGNMDLLDLMPSFLDLQVQAQNLNIKYLMPGYMDVRTPVSEVDMRIGGEITRPVMSGKIVMGKNGEISFPFLDEDGSDANISKDTGEQSNTASKQNYMFSGLKVMIPYDLAIRSPLSDVTLKSENGLQLRHRRQPDAPEKLNLTINGELISKEGKLYLLNNVLNIEEMKIEFIPPPTGEKNTLQAKGPAINPKLTILANFAVERKQGGGESNQSATVKALITGTLQDLYEKKLKFEFSDTQGLTTTEIMAQLTGAGALQKISTGDFGALAQQLSSSVLRGLFDPLTNKLSALLGLEELSFGVAGQSAKGPTFMFNIRSNPFFFLKDYLEANNLNFLNRFTLNGQGTLGGELFNYKIGTQYRFDNHWQIKYGFDPSQQEHSIKLTGDYALQTFLDWLKGDKSKPPEDPVSSPSASPKP